MEQLDPNTTGVDFDRRRFLTGAGRGAGVFLANPGLGLVAAALGLKNFDQVAQAFDAHGQPLVKFDEVTLADLESAGSRRWVTAVSTKSIALLRSAEPLNVGGEPFGFGVGVPAALRIPGPAAERVMMLVPHSEERKDTDLETALSQSIGVSLLEINAKDGQHINQSTWNRRWHAQSTITRQVLNTEGKAEFTDEIGMPRASECLATPWNTFLIASARGLIEINPVSGLALHRAWITEDEVKTTTLIARAGQKLKTLFWSDGLYVVESRQYFDARMPASNHAILSSGHLHRVLSSDWRGPVSLAYHQQSNKVYGCWEDKLWFADAENLEFLEAALEPPALFKDSSFKIHQVCVDETAIWVAFRSGAFSGIGSVIGSSVKPLLLTRGQARLSGAFFPKRIAVSVGFPDEGLKSHSQLLLLKLDA